MGRYLGGSAPGLNFKGEVSIERKVGRFWRHSSWRKSREAKQIDETVECRQRVLEC